MWIFDGFFFLFTLYHFRVCIERYERAEFMCAPWLDGGVYSYAILAKQFHFFLRVINLMSNKFFVTAEQ